MYRGDDFRVFLSSNISDEVAVSMSLRLNWPGHNQLLRGCGKILLLLSCIVEILKFIWTIIVVAVVVLLLYGHGEQLWSCRDDLFGQA